MSSQTPETESQQNITQNEAINLDKQSGETTSPIVETITKKEKRPTKKTPAKARKTTATGVSSVTSAKKKAAREEKPKTRIRIKIAAYDNKVIDKSTKTIIDTAIRSGAEVIGPIPLPTDIKKFTLLRSTFVHKDARDQYEVRTHKRLIDIYEPTSKTMEDLAKLSLPAGVDIEIKM